MVDTTKVTPEVRVIPVHGANKDGRPFVGLNLTLNGGKPVLVRDDVWDVLYAVLPEGLPLRESIRKGILWKMTHRAVRNAAGEIVVESVKSGTTRSVTAGDAF
jgi:hypothetical protein